VGGQTIPAETSDQLIAMTFSSTSISQAAACNIASRWPSFERGKVPLSS